MQIRQHPPEIIDLIPERIDNSHKGTYGRSLIIAGSNQYTGSAALAVEGALKSGAGMVFAVAIDRVAQVIQNQSPEAIVTQCTEKNGQIDPAAIKQIIELIRTNRINSICIGPGLGVSDALNEFYQAFISELSNINCPCVIDADALPACFQALKGGSNLENSIVLTPHPKEFERMIEVSMNESDVKSALIDASTSTKQVIIYKTNQPLVCNQSNIWVSTAGNSALATAGSGDVLAGLISGLMAQGVAAVDSAKLGVYLHGLAAEIGSETLGLRSFLARDICDNIGPAFQELLHQ